MKKPGKIIDLAHPTTSELIRCLILGRKLPDAQRHEAVQELMKINTDLARLGNLLRMALADKNLRPPGHPGMEALFENIQATQAALKTTIKEL